MDPEVPKQPPNPELQEILNHLQHMNADQVIEELNNIQPEAKQIKNQIDKEKEHLEMHKGELPNSVKEGNVQGRLNNITDVIKRTVVAINTRTVTGDIFAGVPNKSKNILISLCTELSSSIGGIGKINPKNSLFFNEIIIRGIEGRLETTTDLISAFNNIGSLEYLHSHLYSEIASLLQMEAKKIGATEEQIKQLMTEEQRKEGGHKTMSKEAIKERREMIEKLDENSDNLRNSIKTAIDRLDISALERSDIAKRIKERTNDPKEQQILLQDELKGIKTQLILKLEDLSRASGSSVNLRNGTLQDQAKAIIRANGIDGQITSKDLAVNFNEFISLLDNLRGNGILESGIYESLIREVTTLRQNNELLLNFHETFMKESQGKGRLAYMALNYITTWSKQDERLLQILDNPEAFIEFAKNDKVYGYNGFKTPEDWKKFTRDLRHVFNTMYEGTASNAKDFWQSTFSELKEGMVYKELTTALFKLGEDLKNNPEFGEKNKDTFISVKDIYAKMEEQAFEGSSLIGGATLTAEKMVDVSLGSAIRSFTYEMLDYKELNQYAHDVNALTESGLGFEKLNEFSSRLRMEDVMRLIRNMPGLSDAIKLYNTNIAMITARSGRAIPVDFGRRSLTVENLDPIGQETLQQLKNLNKIKKLMKAGNLDDTDVIRMVRFAAGLSKGVFSSFFGAVGNNHLAVETTQRQGDPDNPEDKRPFLETSNTFKSTSDRGVEMMFASIDPDQNWLKFEKPRLWFEIRYASAPRNIRNFKPTSKDYWSNHADIYKWAKEGERAIVNGARNELIDHKKNHVFLKDHLKTTIVDLGQREGWRHYDYRSKLVYLKDEKGDFIKDPTTQQRKIDFHRTIMRLRGVGEEAVKIFINDLFRGKADFQLDASGLSLEDVGADIINENRKYLEKFGSLGKKLNDHQKKALHELFYDKYIFQRIRNTQPSLFIAMETRSEIPEDEVRGTRKKDGGFDKGFTFHDQLLDYLVETYKDYNYEKTWIKTHLLPMYTSALQITEQNEWKKHYEEGWKNNEKTGHFDPAKDPFDYKFSETAFDDKENRHSLISFYSDRRASIGKTIEGQNKQWLQDEDFIKNVKGFYRKVEEVIEMERWDHNTVQNKFGDWVHTGEKETLTHRYAKMLKEGRGGVDSYICWNLLNLDEFSFETSGNRMTQRAFSEAALYVSKGAPMLEQIFVERIGGFTRKTVNNDKEFEESVKHYFAEPFQQLHAVMSNIDEDISYDYNGRLIMFLVSATQDDRLNRIGVLGPLTKGVQRRLNKSQSSYMTDKIPVTERQGATSLDTTSRVEIFINTIGNEGLQLARQKNQVIGREKSKFFGLIPGKPIYKKEPSLSIEQLVNEAQAALPTRLTEQIPMLMPIFLIIMAMLAKLAFDKDKKK